MSFKAFKLHKLRHFRRTIKDLGASSVQLLQEKVKSKSALGFEGDLSLEVVWVEIGIDAKI